MTVSFYLISSLLAARVRNSDLDPKGMGLIYIQLFLPAGFSMLHSAIRSVSSPLPWLILVITQKYFRIFIESETVGDTPDSSVGPAPKCRNDLFEAIV